jgi:hypothetical protein
MPGIVVADVGQWISGPSNTTAKEDALQALSAFGGDIDRKTARMLLSMWTRRDELSPRDHVEVLKHFYSSCNG